MANSFMKRTHMAGTLTRTHVDEIVTVTGWVQKRRDLGGLIFVDLRDRSGLVQIVFDHEIAAEAFEQAGNLGSEYVVAIQGKVHLRQAINPNMPTGEIEIFAQTLEVLNTAETPPIYIKDDDDVSENLRLKYRYLDLRKPAMQKKFMVRHQVTTLVRNFLSQEGFLEIETPVLTKPTPEGARDYLVPSRVNPGKFYALPQSPQLFKQLLMVSGFDRYFQIVKCFRDEDLRADRQPEFTQIDCEMSFVDVDQVIEINERLIYRIFKEVLQVEIPLPIPRMTYEEAMKRYGSDKPDIRFGFELVNVSELVKNLEFKVFAEAVSKGGSVRLINVKGAAEKFSRKDITSLEEYVKTYGAKGLAWIKVTEEGISSPIGKFFDETTLASLLAAADGKAGDLLLFVADENSVVLDALGHLRGEVAKRLGMLDKEDYRPLWVTEFPQFEFDPEENRYMAKHHPFTAPMEEDLPFMSSSPDKVRAQAYDIVINGYEVGGGSIRIHSSQLQQEMFKALGFSQEEAWDKFGFLLEAFKYGTPPHGGIAFGLDRLIMLLTQEDNIRQVIAFPKTQNASCPLTNAPAPAEQKQLKELSIDIMLEK